MERGMGDQNKKRSCFPHLQDHQQLKRSCNSFPSGSGAESAIVDELFSPESLAQIELFLRSVVREEMDSKVESHSNFPGSSSSRSTSQLNDRTGEEAVAASGTLEFKLCFQNQIASTIFTNNEIEAENGEPLQVALFDVNNFNDVVRTGPLSSALIEFVVLNGEFGSDKREKETHWTVSHFNKGVLPQRVGKRPLIVGNDQRIRLKNGVAFINNLSFTDNSSWMRSKKFRLGVRIIDEQILDEFPRIGEAVSEPFRVMDHRGEVNKKHHPPRGDDEIWRLEGIGKDGVYHKRLSSKGIKTVDGFVKAVKRDHHSLRKLLGNKVPNKTWKAMVNNALECVPITTFDPSFGQIFVENEAMGGEAFNKNLEVDKQKTNPSNGHGFSGTFGEFQDYDFMFEDYLSLLPHGEASTSYSHNDEVENTSTCNQYYQGAWNKLVPKPK